MRLGSASHVYEIVEGWGGLPKAVRLGYTHGVVIDSQDRVYVHNQSKDAVVVFDREGSFIQSWGEQFAGGGAWNVSESRGRHRIPLPLRLRASYRREDDTRR